MHTPQFKATYAHQLHHVPPKFCERGILDVVQSRNRHTERVKWRASTQIHGVTPPHDHPSSEVLSLSFNKESLSMLRESWEEVPTTHTPFLKWTPDFCQLSTLPSPSWGLGPRGWPHSPHHISQSTPFSLIGSRISMWPMLNPSESSLGHSTGSIWLEEFSF